MDPAMFPTLWTIGHSTRTADEFMALIHARDIRLLIDVRTIPRSRYNPQFNTETFRQSLRSVGIDYHHMATLGGLRKPKRDSVNQGWRNERFRGYADYMQTETFREALGELMAHSRQLRTAIMCAEAVPWRCHRLLVADALVSRGWTVRHILTTDKAEEHKLTPSVVITDNVLTYPAPTGEAESPL